MKFSFIKNDESTYWDEVILIIITLIVLAGGILLIVFKPSFGFVDESISLCLGLLLTISAVMYFPGIIYRLFHNKIKSDDK